MSTQTYANAIEAQRVALAANLTTQGVASVGTEALDALVDKVLDIATESTLTGDALVGEVLDGKLFYSDDPTTQLEGTMPNNADANVEVTDIDGTLIPAGYYNGTGSALLSAAEAAKVIAGNIKDGVTILGVTGSLAGSSTLTGDAIATEVLTGKTFYSDDPDTQLTGTMPNNGADNVEVTDVDGTLIPAGYYNGTGSAVLSATEAAKVITGNIKSGVTLLGVAGDANVVDTSSGDAVAGEILSGKKAWVDGAEITGSLTAATNLFPTVTISYVVAPIAGGDPTASGSIAGHWTRNFYNYMYSIASVNMPSGTFGAGATSFKDTTASTVSHTSVNYVHPSTASPTITILGGATVTASGIVIGRGTAAQSFENYVMSTLIANGTSANQMTYAAADTPTSVSWNSGTKTFSQAQSRTMSNTSGSTIDVTEVGWHRYAQINNRALAYYVFLMERTLLASAVSVPTDHKITITYTINTVFPE